MDDLRPPDGPGAPVYRSGRDYAIHVGALTFGFSAEDFAERVAGAAERVGLVRREALEAEELEDLVVLCAHGAIEHPRSPLAAHLARHARTLRGADDDVVHWLRRLVFRGAWIDQHVSDGRLEPVFEEGRGFRYRSARSGRPLDDDAPAPDWSALRYGPA